MIFFFILKENISFNISVNNGNENNIIAYSANAKIHDAIDNTKTI